jgi:hypothetical protein
MINQLLSKFYLRPIALGFFILIIYLYNFFTPMWNDDYAACFHFGDSQDRLYNINQLLSSQKWLYLNWSGSVITGFIQQFTSAFLGKEVFNVLNTLVVFFLVYIVCYSSVKLEPTKYLISFCVFILFVPLPGETLFWMIAAIGYMWTTLFATLFVFYNHKIKSILWLFVISLIIGTLSYNILCILLPYYSLILFRLRKNLLKELRFLIIPIGILLGGVLLMLAPGNMERYNNMYLSRDLISRIPNFLDFYSKFLYNNWFLFTVVIVHFVRVYFKERKILNEYTQNSIFLIFTISVLSPLAMIIAPEYSERTTFSAFVFMLPFFFYSLFKLYDEFCRPNKFGSAIAFSVLLISTFSILTNSIKAQIEIYSTNEKNIQIIKEEKYKGNFNPKLEPFLCTPTKYSFIYKIRKDKNYISNIHMAAYYDVKSVRAKGDFLQINFDRIVLGNFCLSAKFHSGFQYINCQQAFNKFDGKSIYFDLPDSTTFNQNFEIEVKPNNDEEFKITSIQVCRGNRLQNLMNNYTIEIIKKGAKSKTFQYNYDFIQPKKFNKCFILQLNAF